MLKNRLFFDLHALSREQAMFGNRASNCLHGYSYHVPGQWQGKFKEKLKVIKWQQTSHFLKQKTVAEYLNTRVHHFIVVEIESNKWQLNDLQKLSNATFFQMPNEVNNQGQKWFTVCKLLIIFYSARSFPPQSPTLYVRKLYDGRNALNYLPLIRWLLESKYSRTLTFIKMKHDFVLQQSVTRLAEEEEEEQIEITLL